MIYNYFIFRKIKIIFSNFRNIHFKLYVFNNFIILKFYFNFLKNIYFTIEINKKIVKFGEIYITDLLIFYKYNFINLFYFV